jgi:hypothetical protein
MVRLGLDQPFLQELANRLAHGTAPGAERPRE